MSGPMRSNSISLMQYRGAAASRAARKFVAALVLTVAACADAPTAFIPQPDPAPSPRRALGIVTLRFNVGGNGQVQASLSSPDAGIIGGPRMTLTSPDEPGAASVFIEALPDGGSFTHGTPGSGGYRYVFGTAKIRNAGINSSSVWVPHTTPRTNLTLVATAIGGGINGTPFSQLSKFNGTDADPAIASQIKPTGAVRQTLLGGITSHSPDVLQVFTEAEVAHVPNAVPYGYIVQHATNAGSRTLAANPAPDQFDGLLALGIKIPLQTNPADDVYGFSMSFIVYDDTETRITQSIEEQDPAGQAAFEARVAQLSGLSGITLLTGGSYGGTSSAAVRKLCAIRIAGTVASPTAFLDPAANSCPIISAINPASGTQGTTASVTLTGTGFDPNPGATTLAISGSGITVNNVNVASTTSLTANFVIAGGASTGARSVTVTTGIGTGPVKTFTVLAAGSSPPTLTSISPTFGPRGAPVTLTLTGTNFVSGATVSMDNSDGQIFAGPVTLVSSTTLTAEFFIGPSAATGGRAVTVTTSGGTTSAQTFTITP